MFKNVRFLVADTLALILFSVILGMFIEVVISGMTVYQSLIARAASTPINIIFGRPYGNFRDWLFRVLKLDKSRFFQAALADTLAFALFQIPLYFLVLTLAGATWRQMIFSAGSFVIAVAFSGRIYGVFLDGCRKMVGCRLPLEVKAD